ncbi:MAG: hypothetical protein DCC65_18570 [Planctomycetota bacterium]|nr:MAG: hypothetical protein DCC65_18570 [Planctomycetota bacterium]
MFRPFALVHALVVAVAGTSAAAEEIPLKEIWAFKMPNTKDILELDVDREPLVHALLAQIRDTWNQEKGMVVPGEGRDALENVYRIRVNREKRSQVSPDEPLSLVFFTNATGHAVEIQQVERKGNHFTIRYRFVPRMQADSPQYIALIPIGPVGVGKYSVEIDPLPLEKKYRDLGLSEPGERQINNVCDSFTFIALENER